MLMKWVNLFLLTTVAFTATACEKPGTVLRDPEVYRNEVAFLQMAIEQDTELLLEHLNDGSCSCEDGEWNNEVCEMSALNVVVMEARLEWHIAMMMYLGNLSEENPGDEPEVPDPSTLCPEG